MFASRDEENADWGTDGQRWLLLLRVSSLEPDDSPQCGRFMQATGHIVERAGNFLSLNMWILLRYAIPRV